MTELGVPDPSENDQADNDPAGNLAGRLVDGGHELIQRVYYEDTDFSGRVYHARYLHFMERGRSDYLRLAGYHHTVLAGQGLAFAVHRMTIDFIKPATIDDILTIRTGTVRTGGARLVLAQSVNLDGVELVKAEVLVALIDANGRPARMPLALRHAFSGSH
ncbi:MAG: tol-pal system-associated acyl-CoA thioesterase [Alphaproteobacteria bacterium]